jgi:hypothetical protein
MFDQTEESCGHAMTDAALGIANTRRRSPSFLMPTHLAKPKRRVAWIGRLCTGKRMPKSVSMSTRLRV